MSVKLVILAEDNEKLRFMYSEVLKSVGFNVMTASDGEKAIGLLHKVANPKLIILDVMMPRMNGIETCIQMRKMQGLHPCPIVFLTALDSPECVLECLRAGGDDYLLKTAPMVDFLDRVQYWSRRDASGDGSARRNAIKELDALVSGGSNRDGSSLDGEENTNQTPMNRLAAFINGKASSFSGSDDTLYRFGYMVGLVEAYVPSAINNQDSFNKFMSTLVFKTSIVERKSIESLLANYQRIVNQSLFNKGSIRGRDDACQVDLPMDAAKSPSQKALSD